MAGMVLPARLCAGLVGAVTLLFTPEMAGKRLPGSGPSVESEQEARELVEDLDQLHPRDVG